MCKVSSAYVKSFHVKVTKKLKLFNGRQNRTLMRDPNFINNMDEVQKEAWIAFTMVVKKKIKKQKDLKL